MPTVSASALQVADFAQSCCVTGHVNHSIFWQNLTPPKVGLSCLLGIAAPVAYHIVNLVYVLLKGCSKLSMHAMTETPDVCLLRVA